MEETTHKNEEMCTMIAYTSQITKMQEILTSAIEKIGMDTELGIGLDWIYSMLPSHNKETNEDKKIFQNDKPPCDYLHRFPFFVL